jgi:hypothetical protein
VTGPHDDKHDTLVSTPIALTPSGRESAVLLIDTDPRHAKAIARVVKTAVTCTTTVATPGEAPDDEWDIVIVNFDGLSQDEQNLIRRRYALHARTGRLLLLCGTMSREVMSTWVGQDGVSHFLARHPDADPAEVLVTLQKILRAEIFGIEKYFPWGADTHVYALRSSKDREHIVDEAHRIGTAVGAPTRLVDQFCTAVDELASNALYNAPVDGAGSHRFAHLPRTTHVALEPNEQIQVTFASDGRHMGVSVVDPFGSLAVTTLLEYLSRCLRRGLDQVDDKPGGAGLGLFYVYESMSQFVVNVALGQRTEMIGLLDIRGSFKDFAQRGKSFHAFVTSNPSAV